MSAVIVKKDVRDVRKVAEMLAAGMVGVFPCDTIYGLNAKADERMAERLYEIKRRPQNKSFITLMTVEQLKASTLVVPEDLLSVWPAPLTAILADGNGTTHAVRVPSDPYLAALLPLSGPLYSTSVNFSGEKSLLSFSDIRPVFADLVDFIVEDDLVAGGLPSTLIDCTKSPRKILRQGAFDASCLL